MRKLGWGGTVKHIWFFNLLYVGALIGMWLVFRDSNIRDVAIWTVAMVLGYIFGTWRCGNLFIRCLCGRVIYGNWFDSCLHCGAKVPDELRKK